MRRLAALEDADDAPFEPLLGAAARRARRRDRRASPRSGSPRRCRCPCARRARPSRARRSRSRPDWSWSCPTTRSILSGRPKRLPRICSSSPLGDQRLQLALEAGALFARNAKQLRELARGGRMMDRLADAARRMSDRVRCCVIRRTRMTCRVADVGAAWDRCGSRSPSRSKNCVGVVVVEVVARASADAGRSRARRTSSRSTMAPAASVGPSMPSVPMLAAATSRPSAPKRRRHRERELLIAAALARAGHRHRRFTRRRSRRPDAAVDRARRAPRARRAAPATSRASPVTGSATTCT